MTSGEKSVKDAARTRRNTSVAGIAFTAIVTVATIFTLFKLADFSETVRTIVSAEGYYVALAVLWLAAYFLLYPLGFCLVARRKKLPTKFRDDYVIGATEHFFSGITPYQVGAQPFQIYLYTRRGVKASDATALVLVNFVAMLLASNIYVAATLFYSRGFFASFAEAGALWVPITGITMNFFTLVLFICVATCKWVRDFLTGAIKLICRVKIFDKLFGKGIPAFEKYCENAQRGMREAMKDIKSFLLLVALKLVAFTCYYAVAYCSLMALDLCPFDFFRSIPATAFTVHSVVWLPTPGTGGGIEYAFSIVFGLRSSGAAAAAVVWRGFTYYALMLLSALFYVGFAIALGRRKRRRARMRKAAAIAFAKTKEECDRLCVLPYPPSFIVAPAGVMPANERGSDKKQSDG